MFVLKRALCAQVRVQRVRYLWGGKASVPMKAPDLPMALGQRAKI